MKLRALRSRLCSLALGLGLVLCAQPSQAQDRARRVHDLVLDLRLDLAEKELASSTGHEDALLALERGRFLLYAARYEQAAQVLERADVLALPEGTLLATLSRNCARSVAGALEVRDEAHALVVRMQDDRDQALVPLLGEVAQQARKALRRDLGVELPVPVRIELVRDHFSLAAMTGLPESAARTTGTVAVANWGRVAMVSPRATPRGYPWMDTLAHELTHLALSQGSRDRAPLWLQEGVAKTEETRWRAPDASDNYPPPDTVAALGFDKGLAKPLDAIGPSVAMLPTPQQAMVVFAEVQSFVRYFLEHAPSGALPKLLRALHDTTPAPELSDLLKQQTGRDLHDWTQAWQQQLQKASRELPPEYAWDSVPKDQSAAAEAYRLGELLLGRGHKLAASRLLEQARDLAPRELRIRYLLAKAYQDQGQNELAFAQLETVLPPMVPDAEAFALRGAFLRQQGDQVGAHVEFFRAVAIHPWSTAVACEQLAVPLLPTFAPRAQLCEASRRWPLP